ncbi:MAG TPA: class I SAM-dependent methyltransferase [Tepidisphaeraceae bacterium]|jgi:ubiquinone/menaquinone biosynthesis C-methylase UbiE|nr:class I SAM-dependent methyltransferase [Tepidisphaeraceae bacterium]
MALPDRARFESAYAGLAPWDIGRPQKALVEMAGQITGSLLDSGCGTGESALYFAGRGNKVTGIDFLAEPIARAKQKAAERGLTATFLVMDALTLKAGRRDSTTSSTAACCMFSATPTGGATSRGWPPS